jgi:hypothetical protein
VCAGREGEVAIHFAALPLFIYGMAEEAFDWSRPFQLRFNTDDAKERKKAFDEHCQMIGGTSGDLEIDKK